MACAAGPDFVDIHPNVPDYPAVECAAGIVAGGLPGEGKTQVGCIGRPVVAVNAQQEFGFEMVRTFFQRFADGRCSEGLTGFEVAGRLIQPRPARCFLFNQQKLAVTLNDRSDGDMWFPGWLVRGHGADVTGLRRFAPNGSEQCGICIVVSAAA